MPAPLMWNACRDRTAYGRQYAFCFLLVYAVVRSMVYAVVRWYGVRSTAYRYCVQAVLRIGRSSTAYKLTFTMDFISVLTLNYRGKKQNNPNLHDFL